MPRLSVRWKMTLWYGAVLSIVLTIFSTAVFLTMRHQLLERIDQGLVEELADVVSEVQRARDEPSLGEWLERRFAHHEGFDYQITRPSGERFFISVRLRDRILPLPVESGSLETAAFRDISIEEKDWRVVSVCSRSPGETLTIQVARSLEGFKHESNELLATLLVTGPLMVLLAVGGGYFLARRALAPVDRITATANRITADRLGERVEVSNPDDELGALAHTLNRMIERLERSFAETQRFTADAAHELRTPLAVIRNEVEVALRTPRGPDEYAQVLETTLEEVNRLSGLAEQLLFLSRQDAGLFQGKKEEIDVGVLLREVVSDMRFVAKEKGVDLTLGTNVSCRIMSDPILVRRVLYNILDNAIKYTSVSGRVTVESSSGPSSWMVVVADNGVGISPEHLPHIFERFYRVDASRGGDGNGAGLGLAICRSIVMALGGTITLQSEVGTGTVVQIRLTADDGNDLSFT